MCNNRLIHPLICQMSEHKHFKQIRIFTREDLILTLNAKISI